MRAAHVAYPFLAPSRHLLRANEAREPEAKRLLCIPSDFTSPKAMPLAERLSLFKRDHSNLYFPPAFEICVAGRISWRASVNTHNYSIEWNKVKGRGIFQIHIL
jgi:hypothetical protein